MLSKSLLDGKFYLSDGRKLEIGMKVTLADVSDVYDLYMIIKGINKLHGDKDKAGTLVYFGKHLSKEALKLMGRDSICIIWDSDEMNGEVFYDE